MTIHLADQERTCRRAPDAATDPSRRERVRTAVDMSIERRSDPETGGLSKADAVWPQRLRRVVRVSLTYWGHPDLIATAELLLTELATNALRHGKGLDIGVLMYFQNDRCVIEVNDGSTERPKPRRSGPTDEDGRGLLLVESLAESWGVSPDGTTTWCCLHLTKGPTYMEPAATTAPVLREMRMELPADSSAVTTARIQARSLLTMLAWPGNVHAAIDVLHHLVDNAVAHGLTPGATGQSLAACLRVAEAHELLIDVTDPNPTFPDFDKAIRGESGRGLGEIVQFGATITWSMPPGIEGKTVRAALRPSQVDL
ncbi:ATP-binding protein [Streptomyces bobili]|uniref:ATP-binding protein n=1 Tax=Streptomyces bobili TaxID=67280 RepID=UPI00380D06A7